MTLRMSAGLLQGVAQSHSVIRLEPHLSFIWFVLFELSNYESLYPTQKRRTGWEENMLPAAWIPVQLNIAKSQNKQPAFLCNWTEVQINTISAEIVLFPNFLSVFLCLNAFGEKKKGRKVIHSASHFPWEYPKISFPQSTSKWIGLQWSGCRRSSIETQSLSSIYQLTNHHSLISSASNSAHAVILIACLSAETINSLTYSR